MILSKEHKEIPDKKTGSDRVGFASKGGLKSRKQWLSNQNYSQK